MYHTRPSVAWRSATAARRAEAGSISTARESWMSLALVFWTLARTLRDAARRHLVRAALAALLAVAFAPLAQAEGIAVKSATLEATDDGWQLEADFDIQFSPRLEEAVNRGGAHAARHVAAAQAVPGERDRFPGLDAHVGLASLVDRSVRVLIFLCVVAGTALVYLMSEAPSNTALFTQNLQLLLYLAGAMALGLMALIVYQLLTLRRKLRERVFGSKLTLRLVLVFALMALIPGGLVYAISFQFLQRSIESWFDVRMDESLRAGLNLAQNALANSRDQLAQKAETMAQSLAVSPGDEIAALNRLREQHSIEEATLLTSRGRVIAQSGAEPVALLPDLPSPSVLRQVRAGQAQRLIESIPDRGLYLRAIVPVNVSTIADEGRILQVLQRVPSSIAKDADLVNTGITNYGV